MLRSPTKFLVLAVVLYLVIYNFVPICESPAENTKIANKDHYFTSACALQTENTVLRDDSRDSSMNLSKEEYGKQKKFQYIGGNNIREDSETKNESAPKTLLTLFSTWENDKGNVTRASVHKNTLKNWSSFRPMVTSVLFTNDSVLAKEAQAEGWTTYPISKTAKNGLPVLKYMFIDAMKATDSIFYCYANSDILFDGGLIKTLVNLVYTLGNDLYSIPLFMTGLRWNVINVTHKDISPRSNIKVLLKERGRPFITSAEDYFITNRIYPWQEIPEVVVGAKAYDNWLVLNAREKKHLVIDTSRTMPALHQSLDKNNYISMTRNTSLYNSNLLSRIYKKGLQYVKGSLGCIQKYTAFVNDTFVLVDKSVETC